MKNFRNFSRFLLLRPKHDVVRAWQRVKANKGTYGVDGETIKQFESNLKSNLYKIWNRMSSGSYFPPPIKTVAIPKKTGGERKLGIPTVSDRIAQMVVKLHFEPLVEPWFHQGFLWLQVKQIGTSGAGDHPQAMLAL